MRYICLISLQCYWIFCENMNIKSKYFVLYEDLQEHFMRGMGMIKMSRLEDVIASEFSTVTIADMCVIRPDKVVDCLKKYVPETELPEIDEEWNQYVIASEFAMFEQGIIRGIAIAKAGVI